VKQAVAVGMADARLAEVVAVFVELESGQPATPQELIDFCRQQMASFKVPRRVEFVGDWPMTGAGKIQRYVLKESLAQAAPTRCLEPGFRAGVSIVREITRRPGRLLPGEFNVDKLG
jgi:acyl-CoA synthetase (AMP-forming)/AMP-acid ligase II